MKYWVLAENADYAETIRQKEYCTIKLENLLVAITKPPIALNNRIVNLRAAQQLVFLPFLLV